MVRRYDEQVQVRRGEAGEPHSFIWRGRLYLVREVLGHWQERRSWWREAVATTPAGEGDATTGGLATLARERRIWRVAAAAGAAAPTGVYELGEVPGLTDDAGWQLVQVAD